MSEQSKTPRTDSEAFWIGRGEDRKQYQGGEYVRAAVARSIETELADARAALREHVEAHEADFPPFDMGQRAQDEWAQRRSDATRNARNLLAKQG